jgi:signal transduction histidine kinase
MSSLKHKIRRFFDRLSLSQRFMLAGSAILFLGMLGIGAWVERQIETGVIHRTGATTALYVDSFIAPQLQELGASEVLLPEHVDALSRFIQDTPIGQQFVAFRVWSPRGRLLFTTDQSPVGKTYPMHEGLLRARLGEVVSEVSRLEDVENAILATKHERLLETYSPVWLSGTDRVIAVAEFYQLTDELDAEVRVLQDRSRLVVGLAILLMFLLLSGFVRRASDTISRQQAELAQKVSQLTALLQQNRELHGRVRRAAASVTQLNESHLRQVGAELHDGPAQDLGLSLLRLDELAGKLEAQPPGTLDHTVLDRLGEVQASLGNALKEMRAIAAGASLPQLAELSPTETVVRAVRSHQRRTATQVALTLDNVPEQAALPVRITVYRLIQEALNNSFRHAGGSAQQVHVRGEGNTISVEISDSGSGFRPESAEGQDGHLGLAGMRERVESLGGQFTIQSQPDQGTTVSAVLPCHPEGDDL